MHNREISRGLGLFRWGLAVGGCVDDGRRSGNRKITPAVRPQCEQFRPQNRFSLRGVPRNPSTGDPQMGIDTRIAQNGHDGASYPQCYPHAWSTPGDILGIKTDWRRRRCVRAGFVEWRGRSWGGPWLGFDTTREVGDLVEQGPTLGHQLPDFAVRMHHRGVIPPPERLTDFRKREIR